jgi:hypothetical protein
MYIDHLSRPKGDHVSSISLVSRAGYKARAVYTDMIMSLHCQLYPSL